MQKMLCLLLCFGAVSAGSPILKVVSLLGSLQEKVLRDGEVEQKQYEAFSEWCEDVVVKTQYEIKDGKAKEEGLQAAIMKYGADVDASSSNIDDFARQVATNEKDLAAARDIRTKEHGDFAAADSDLAETIDMLGRAIGIIAKSTKAGSFAQVSSQFHDLTDALSLVLQGSVFSTQDKSKLQALIQSSQPDDDLLSRSAPEAAAYENHSGSILTVLEDMKDKAIAMRNNAQKAEMNAQHSFDLLQQSLKKSLEVDNKGLNEEKKFKAAATEAKATAEGDLVMTQKALAEAEAKLSAVSTDCQQKAADWEISQKSRAAEMEALTQAKKIISDMTGGAESQAYGLLEMTTGTSSSDAAAGRVVDLLKSIGRKSDDMAMAQLAQRVSAATLMDSSADVFSKVRGMIEQMLEKLIGDAKQEASHKAWCDEEMGESKAKIEDHMGTIDNLSAKVDKAEATISKLTDSIANLENQLAALLKQQATMDKMRVEEKATFQVAQKDYQDGVQGLTMALKILRDYYGAAEADAALVQQPAVGVHTKATGESTGIIGLLEVAQSDFSKLLAEAEVEEEAAQAEYEKVSQENQVSKAMKEQDVKYQTKEKANLEKAAQDLKNDRESEQAELDAVSEYFDRLKPACIEQPETYEERKMRREAEIAGLKEALTILEGEGPAVFLAVRSRVRRHE